MIVNLYNFLLLLFYLINYNKSVKCLLLYTLNTYRVWDGVFAYLPHGEMIDHGLTVISQTLLQHPLKPYPGFINSHELYLDCQ